jgi:hypothetical protein
MRRYLRVSLSAVFSLAVFSPATASQVTKQDLSGKKICWDSGLISTYAPGGEYTSGKLPGGVGTWAIATGGTSIYSSSWSGFVDIDKLSNGTFKSAHFGGVGKYCK